MLERVVWRSRAGCVAAFALVIGLHVMTVRSADALSRYAGSHYYVAALGSGLYNPLFTKEFSEGQGVPLVGGRDEIQLPSEKSIVGWRIGFEQLSYKRAGIGASLTYWKAGFDNVQFRYDEAATGSRVARYVSPAHTYLFCDLNGVYIPWESPRNATAMYGLISLVADREEYRIDKFTVGGADFESREESRWSPRFGFGVGARVHLGQRISLWAEKRWVVGETFGVPQTDETGAPSGETQDTLHAPIGSVGFGLYF